MDSRDDALGRLSPGQPQQATARSGMVDSLAWHIKTKPPLAIFLAVAILCMGLIILLQMLTQQDLYFLYKLYLGYDYSGFYRAAEAVLQGGNPYNAPPSRPVFSAPPIAAIANIPLTYLPFKTARVIVSLLTFVSVVASMFLVHKVFPPHTQSTRSRVNDMAILLIFMTIPMYSYPFHFLFDRGNADGFTLLLLSLGIYFLAGRTTFRDLAAGFFFAAAISFKAYPVLVVLPLLAMRRWLPLAALAGAMACFVLASPMLWVEWVERIAESRIEYFRADENGSLAYTFYYIGGFFGYSEQLKSAAIYVWGGLLLSMFCLDIKSKSLDGNQPDSVSLAALLLYVPFMAAVPQVAYHYELVCVLIMLPVVSCLWSNAADPKEKSVLLLITVGLILTQFHAYAVERLLIESQGHARCAANHRSGACFPHWVPGFGLFLVMAGSVAYKALRLHAATGMIRLSEKLP